MMNIGDQITLGIYAGDAVVWKAIAEENGRFLLLSEKVLDYRPFHPVDISEKLSGQEYYETNWGSCELRQWLNGAFFSNTFAAEEAAHIPAVSVTHPSYYMTLYSSFPGTGQTEDRIFLLSKEEVEQYLPKQSDRAALLTEYARGQARDVCALRNYGAWWLRTTVRNGYGAHCLYVYNSVHREKFLGAIISSMGAGVWSTDVGVRPAMWYQP